MPQNGLGQGGCPPNCATILGAAAMQRPGVTPGSPRSRLFNMPSGASVTRGSRYVPGPRPRGAPVLRARTSTPATVTRKQPDRPAPSGAGSPPTDAGSTGMAVVGAFAAGLILKTLLGG